MREAIVFESYGNMVVAFRLRQSSPKIANFHIVEAVDYPSIDYDHDKELATVNHFNFIGSENEVVDEFEDANLLASGSIVLQFPEDRVVPIAYNIELQNGVIFTGREFNDLCYIINNLMLEKAFLFLQGEDIASIERVPITFPKS